MKEGWSEGRVKRGRGRGWRGEGWRMNRWSEERRGVQVEDGREGEHTFGKAVPAGIVTVEGNMIS